MGQSSMDKAKFVALVLIFIGMLLMLIAWDSIGADIKNKTSDLFQDAGAKIQQTELPLSPQIAIVKGMFVSNICEPTAYCL